MSSYPASVTGVQIPACPACGGYPHSGGVGACPEVSEVEFDSLGRVHRIIKRPQPHHAGALRPPIATTEAKV